MPDTREMAEAVAREPAMVRRVAEAMYEGYRRYINAALGPDKAPIPWAELDGVSMRCYCAAAREGIAAMRVATKPMSDAGWTASETASRIWQSCTPRELWAAMIDAAIASPVAAGGKESLRTAPLAAPDEGGRDSPETK